ncbi:hypothetical protein F4604DRAFT_1679248 [Suillus subluteus]|nr:hypothetical protein F4604DRAFT_1679248 [Suillus subluteus]
MPPGKSALGTGVGPPKTHSPTPANAPNTRKTTCNPTTVGDIMAMPNDIMDTADAEKFLNSKLLCIDGQPFTLPHLSSILFHITQMSNATPAPVTAAIRAVAFILRKHVVCEIAEAAAKNLVTSLSTSLSASLSTSISSTLTESLSTRLVDHTIAALAPQVARIHAASEALSRTAQQADETLTTTLDKAERLHRIASNERTEQEGGVSVAAERIEEAADALYATVTDCQNAIKLLTPSLDTTQERVNHLSTQMTTATATVPTQAPMQPSYSAIAAAHLPPKVDQAIGRAAIRASRNHAVPTRDLK